MTNMDMKQRPFADLCRWIEDDDGVWNTDCGEAFVFIDSGPSENRMSWCCYCGDKLRAERSSDTQDVLDASGRVIAPPQTQLQARPSGPHEANGDARQPVRE